MTPNSEINYSRSIRLSNTKIWRTSLYWRSRQNSSKASADSSSPTLAQRGYFKPWFQVVQCYKCAAYGRTAGRCTSKSARCPFCSLFRVNLRDSILFCLIFKPVRTGIVNKQTSLWRPNFRILSVDTICTTYACVFPSTIWTFSLCLTLTSILQSILFKFLIKNSQIYYLFNCEQAADIEKSACLPRSTKLTVFLV